VSIEEETREAEARLDQAIEENHRLSDHVRGLLREGVPEEIVDQTMFIIGELARSRNKLRHIHEQIARDFQQYENEEFQRAFAFTDEEVFRAVCAGHKTAWDVIRHLRLEHGGPSGGPITSRQLSRAAWALRRLRDQGRVTQERVVVYGRRCASVWRRA